MITKQGIEERLKRLVSIGVFAEEDAAATLANYDLKSDSGKASIARLVDGLARQWKVMK